MPVAYIPRTCELYNGYAPYRWVVHTDAPPWTRAQYTWISGELCGESPNVETGWRSAVVSTLRRLREKVVLSDF